MRRSPLGEALDGPIEGGGDVPRDALGEELLEGGAPAVPAHRSGTEPLARLKEAAAYPPEAHARASGR